MHDEHTSSEEYVNEVELDELEDIDNIPIDPSEVEIEKIEPSVDDFDAEDFEDAIGSEEDTTIVPGAPGDGLRSALQGGGDDKNDE